MHFVLGASIKYVHRCSGPSLSRNTTYAPSVCKYLMDA